MTNLVGGLVSRGRSRMNDGPHRERVERLHPWFALQLQFAEVFASKAGVPLDTAVTFYTNLHRRFGFGRPSANGRSPEWESFVQELVSLRMQAERIVCTKAFAQARLANWRNASDRQFGCFSFELLEDGVVRLHFAPNDQDDGVGPLSRLKYARRIEDLTEMFAHIRRQHPVDARYVVGGSWLYNLEAYRRLFPAAYVASLRVHTTPSALFGGSWWGQFVDRNENIVAERARTFSENLAYLDAAEVWKVFPLPALIARADIDVFHEHYGSNSPVFSRTIE